MNKKRFTTIFKKKKITFLDEEYSVRIFWTVFTPSMRTLTNFGCHFGEASTLEIPLQMKLKK